VHCPSNQAFRPGFPQRSPRLLREQPARDVLGHRAIRARVGIIEQSASHYVSRAQGPCFWAMAPAGPAGVFSMVAGRGRETWRELHANAAEAQWRLRPNAAPRRFARVVCRGAGCQQRGRCGLNGTQNVMDRDQLAAPRGCPRTCSGSMPSLWGQRARRGAQAPHVTRVRRSIRRPRRSPAPLELCSGEEIPRSLGGACGPLRCPSPRKTVCLELHEPVHRGNPYRPVLPCVALMNRRKKGDGTSNNGLRRLQRPPWVVNF